VLIGEAPPKLLKGVALLRNYLGMFSAFSAE
jgi:hypothetical protein